MKHWFQKAMIVMSASVLVISAGIISVYADEAPLTYDYQDVDKDYVVAATDGTDYLYLRYGPGMDYDIICEIKNGTVLHIYGTSLDPGGGFRWGSTRYNGQRGWVSMSHVSEYDPSKTSSGGSSVDTTPVPVNYDVAVQATDGTDYLYLRTGPDMKYDIICNIYNGERLHISAEAKDASGGFSWGQTVYNGRNGWVSLKHVTTAAADTPTPAPTQAPTAEPTPTTRPEPSVSPETPEPKLTPSAEPAVTPAAKTPAADPRAPAGDFQKRLITTIIIACAIVGGAVAALLVLFSKKRK